MNTSACWRKFAKTAVNFAQQHFDNFLAQDCLLCGHQSRQSLLCHACEISLPYLQKSFCPQCAGFSTTGEICGHCLSQPAFYDFTKTLYRYEFPVDQLIHSFKYGHRLSLADYFASSLLAKTQDLSSDLIMPLPLYPTRLKERGFNQALLIAKSIGGKLGLPVDSRSCQRIGNTKAQVDLRWPERAKNVRHAFACTSDLSGRKIMLVDDVMTSGASLNECARILKKQGALEVSLLVVARAQKPGTT